MQFCTVLPRSPIRSTRIRSSLKKLRSCIEEIANVIEKRKTISRLYQWLLESDPTAQEAQQEILNAEIVSEGDYEFCRILPDENAVANFKSYLRKRMN